jgi:hypothetical protein
MVRFLIDDFGVPFHLKAKGSLHLPVRSTISGNLDNLEVVHECWEIFKIAKVGVNVVDGTIDGKAALHVNHIRSGCLANSAISQEASGSGHGGATSTSAAHAIHGERSSSNDASQAAACPRPLLLTAIAGGLTIPLTSSALELVRNTFRNCSLRIFVFRHNLHTFLEFGVLFFGCGGVRSSLRDSRDFKAAPDNRVTSMNCFNELQNQDSFLNL